MRVLSRGRLLLPLVCVVASLLAPTAAAAADDVYLLAAAGDSNTPQNLIPLVQTATGIVYRNEFTSSTWVKLHDPAQAAQEESRLTDPEAVGDLMSTYDAGTSTLRWRTIADATLHETVVPPELTFVVRTATGYLASQGDGPYGLVAVDLLGGGTQTVIGSVADLDGVLAGPLGAAVPGPDGPGQWLYFPYDGSAPAGQAVQAPVGADECLVNRAHLYCWSATQLSRLPVTGEAGTTITATPRSVVQSPDGIAYTVPDVRYLSSGWHEVWSWRTGQLTPVRLVDGVSGFPARLAPVTGGTGVALAGIRGLFGSNGGIYRFSGSTSFPTTKVVAPAREPRIASAVALGPGRVVWGENTDAVGGMLGRDLTPRVDRGLDLGGVTGQTPSGGNGNVLGVSGSRIAYAKTSAPPGLGLTGVTGDPRLDAAEVLRSTLSGQRVVWQSRDADGVRAWRLTDLTAKTTEPLPGALSYDLWGERLVRLDNDGSVWLLDLRTEAEPVQLAPSLDGGAGSGTVHVAGDAVAWDVTPADPQAPDPGVLLRDLTTADPAEPVTGLAVLQDLSTGYAVGCSGSNECAPVALSLADGAVTPVDTDGPMVVDGSLLGFINGDRLPAVRTLPQYDDAPRLLASPGIPNTIDVTRSSLVVRIAASQPLTS